MGRESRRNSRHSCHGRCAVFREAAKPLHGPRWCWQVWPVLCKFTLCFKLQFKRTSMLWFCWLNLIDRRGIVVIVVVVVLVAVVVAFVVAHGCSCRCCYGCSCCIYGYCLKVYFFYLALYRALHVSWTFSGQNLSPMTRYAPALGIYSYQTQSAVAICPSLDISTTPTPGTPSSPRLRHGVTWQLETEDWSSKAILAQNCGGWRATYESWTSDRKTTCSGPFGLAETSGNSCVVSDTLLKKRSLMSFVLEILQSVTLSRCCSVATDLPPDI